MKKSCKFCWVLSALLITMIAGLGYVFLNPGNLVKSEDGRAAIVLSVDERDLVLSEMRGFLEGIETIVSGITEKDMDAIAESAEKMGMSSAAQVPLALMGKLPSEFRSLGMATHTAFDELALEARGMGDEQVILAGLGELINNCTTCHSAYRIEADGQKGN